MSNLLKKVTLGFLSALVLFFSVAPYLSVSAAPSTWYDQTPAEYFAKVYDPTNPSEIFGERYTAAQVQWVMYSLLTFPISAFFGTKGMTTITCLMNIASGQVNVNICLAALTAGIPPAKKIAAIPPPTPKQNLWALVFADRSLSGISYVRHKIANFTLVPVAHAQVVGFGFDALQPVQAMWSAMRDIAFSFFVIVAVIFAFLIMFRVKLSPQTVITVQSALPKIIIAIITVTFSYAIAGFLIDLMYVVIGLVSIAATRMFSFAFGPVALGAPQYFNFLTLGQPIGLNFQFGITGLTIAYLVFFLISFILVMAINLGVAGVALTGLMVGLLVAFVPGLGVFMLILMIIIGAIAIIAAIWHAIKIFWTLLKAFVSVILLTVFAPLQLTLGILMPNFGFGAWVKSYLSALSTFVVTGILMLFSYAFLIEGVSIAISSIVGGADILRSVVLALAGNSVLANTFVGQNGWPPLLGVGNAGWTGLLFIGVSFVIFTTIPKSAELIQSFIQGKQFAYGTAIGQAMAPFGVGWNLFGAPLWNTAARNREEDYVENMFGNIRERLGANAGTPSNPTGYTSDLDRAGVKVPKNLFNEIHQLNETLTKGKG